MEQNEESQIGLRSIDLLEGEHIVFERAHVVLTNMRLMASWSERIARDIVMVKDIDGVRRIDGGQDSRLSAGLKVLGIGIALAAINVPIDKFVISPLDLGRAVDIVNFLLFVAWVISVAVGAYLILTSLIRVKPHTSLLFIRFKHKDVRVSFPGRNNPDADKLRAVFNRQQRATPL